MIDVHEKPLAMSPQGPFSKCRVLLTVLQAVLCYSESVASNVDM